jgi:hypothetical protein
MSIGERLMSIPKWALFATLIVVASVPLFVKIPVPNTPLEPAIDLYGTLMSIPEGSTILIASDWTKSTRGESNGHFDGLMRILMRRKIKCVIYSSGDPQAPQVARDAIGVLNAARRAKNQPTYDRWNDWVTVGFFPNAEACANAIANNVRVAFAGKTDYTPEGASRDVFQSPVLQNIKKVSDFKLMVVITASKTSNITIERIYGKGVDLAMMVTGVMGPESLPYYSSGQIKGLAVGLKGVYDIEQLLESGITPAMGSKFGTVPGFPGEDNIGNGTRYYPTLHFCLALLILAVIIGNVGMALNRRKAA